MKLLKKMLLINWHYFWQELIEFENINFLTGKNAAGKSTVIDAMQLLLLGDTNAHFFNKAANEKSARNLKGYLRGEIGDDGDIGFRYLRDGRFTSYIACEFHDHLKNKDFTLGVVFDCYEDGDFEHRFFVLDSAIPENLFVVNNVPMSYKELRSFVSRNYKRGRFDFPDTNRRYQDILKGKLGGVKNKYFSLFKKAVPFSPITDIETFITEYICDVRSPVDISLMQDNIGRAIIYKVNRGNQLIKSFRVFENILEVNSLINLLKQYCRKIILFGSCARGEDTTESDMELFVEADEDNTDKIWTILSDYFSDREIKPVIVDTVELWNCRIKIKPFMKKS